MKKMFLAAALILTFAAFTNAQDVPVCYTVVNTDKITITDSLGNVIPAGDCVDLAAGGIYVNGARADAAEFFQNSTIKTDGGVESITMHIELVRNTAIPEGQAGCYSIKRAKGYNDIYKGLTQKAANPNTKKGRDSLFPSADYSKNPLTSLLVITALLSAVGALIMVLRKK